MDRGGGGDLGLSTAADRGAFLELLGAPQDGGGHPDHRALGPREELVDSNQQRLHPAAGRHGGLSGAPGRVFITGPDGVEQLLKGKGVETVPCGVRDIGG